MVPGSNYLGLFASPPCKHPFPIPTSALYLEVVVVARSEVQPGEVRGQQMTLLLKSFSLPNLRIP